MKKILQLGLILAGAAAFTLTAATAKCADSNDTHKEKKKEMKCQDGKCGTDKMKAKAEQKVKEESKEAVTKGKCGQGKCS